MFELSDELEELRGVVREFARKEIAPNAVAWDRDEAFPADTVRAMGELGLFGLSVPEEWGGAGAGLSAQCVAIEEIARWDASVAITLSAGVGLGLKPILRFGTPAQKDRWLPDLVMGRALGAFGLTEPDAGSDAAALRSRAVLDEPGKEWVLNGEKAFITNSGTTLTSLITVAARTGPDEISNLIVPAGAAGLTVGAPYRKVGWRASDTHPLHFDDCRLPADSLLGERGAGLRQFLSILDEGRVAIAALSVGVAQACLEDATAYARERKAFGGPIGRFQATAFRCSDMAVAVDAARLLTYRAAALADAGRDYRREAAVAKLFASEAAADATRSATQVLGGLGFLDETRVARHYRDAKILEIGEGTSEVQRLVIARCLGLPVQT